MRRWVLICLCLALAPAWASSHRDAPFSASTPNIDGTDFYMFRSWEEGREGFVTLIANYTPLQIPSGFANYFTPDPYATYQIHVSNDNDPAAEIIFNFKPNLAFQPQTVTTDDGNPRELPFLVSPALPIVAPGDQNLGLIEEYFLEVVVGADLQQPQVIQATNVGQGGTAFLKPVDNLGEQAIPNYDQYAELHIYDWQAPGVPNGQGRVFVGQRQDPFYVNLGQVFDLINVAIPPDSRSDQTQTYNVTSFCIEVPISFLDPQGTGAIGAWTTALLPRQRQFNPNVSNPNDVLAPPNPQLGFQQVSRLGNPLVNELIIGLGTKDQFNASSPAQDGALFLDFIINPVLAELMDSPRGSQLRSDLVQVFATGLPNVNQTSGIGEMLRLGLEVDPVPPQQQDPLGIFGTPPDPAGYPNGRRPADDVVDIVLTAVGGALLGPPLGDGVTTFPEDFSAGFPFLKAPFPEDASFECTEFTSANDPQGQFTPVPEAFVRAASPSEIIVPLNETPPEEYFLLQHAPPTRRILLDKQDQQIRVSRE